MKFYVQDRGEYRDATHEELLAAVKAAMNQRFRKGRHLASPTDSVDFLKAQLGDLEHEVFCVLWLDNRHHILRFDPLFRGTVDGASVHPREVVKEGLAVNAAACVLAHVHPSGIGTPSDADQLITRRLKDALGLVDIRVLDHIIVGEECISMAQRGLI